MRTEHHVHCWVVYKLGQSTWATKGSQGKHAHHAPQYSLLVQVLLEALKVKPDHGEAYCALGSSRALCNRYWISNTPVLRAGSAKCGGKGTPFLDGDKRESISGGGNVCTYVAWYWQANLPIVGLFPYCLLGSYFCPSEAVQSAARVHESVAAGSHLYRSQTEFTSIAWGLKSQLIKSCLLSFFQS